MGAQRWIPLGFVSFQPSEIFRIFFILAVSRYLSGMDQKVYLDLKELLKMIMIFYMLPAVLIIKQPHLGTVLILLFVFFSMLVVAGIRRKIIVVGIIIGFISVPFFDNIVWDNMKEYQKRRLVAFIDPYADQHGIGYHTRQSKVTIGSGGFLGKGYLKGTQGPLRFLPERHTDFIFSVFAEEWGMLGSFFLFLLYLYIIIKGFDTARKARDPAGSFLALGVTFMFCFYFIINVGMTLNMVPVVGVPLPFMSYGGTALLSNFLMLGILTNVGMRRFPLFY
jgi:rod shape determining protein RodA